MHLARLPETQFRIDHPDGDLVLRRQTGRQKVGYFWFFWLAAWTAGCVLPIWKLSRAPTPDYAVVALFFLAGWVLALHAFLESVFGYETLRVGPRGLEFRSLFHSRTVGLAEIKSIAPFITVDDRENDRLVHALRIETLGKPIRLGEGVPEPELLRLSDLIREQVEALGSEVHVQTLAELAGRRSSRVELIRREEHAPVRPSDCNIVKETAAGVVSILRRGPYNLSSVGGLAVLCLLWNGAVVFLGSQLVKHSQAVLTVFLIPFGIIGVAFILALTLAFTAVFTTDRWIVVQNAIDARKAFFGLGRSRRIELDRLDHLELRNDPRWRRMPMPTSSEQQNETPYSLALVSRRNRDLLVLRDLTEGEARWLGGELYDLLERWLAAAPSPPRNS